MVLKRRPSKLVVKEQDQMMVYPYEEEEQQGQQPLVLREHQNPNQEDWRILVAMEQGLQIEQMQVAIHTHRIHRWIKIYLLPFLFLSGWLWTIWEQSHKIHARHQYLVQEGPPEECIDYKTSLWAYWNKKLHQQQCSDYYIELEQTEYPIPNLLQVTVLYLSRTMIQPMQVVLDMIYECSWLIQFILGLAFVLCIGLMILTHYCHWMIVQPWIRMQTKKDR